MVRMQASGYTGQGIPVPCSTSLSSKSPSYLYVKVNLVSEGQLMASAARAVERGLWEEGRQGPVIQGLLSPRQNLHFILISFI